MEARPYTRLDGFAVVFSEKGRRLHYGRVAALLSWPGISLLLILAKLVHSLNWPWMIVLTPVWLPLLVFSMLLLGAMWLDQLST
ncbi:MAG: hypothetical protein JO189_16050 [Deltaproteobacteria bacterium]|nr:hypothetical protein [Deltaproteobacteria bacterium]